MKSTKVQNPRCILPYLAYNMPMRVRGYWAHLRTRSLALREREPPEVKRRIFFFFFLFYFLLPSDRRQPVVISVGALCGGLLPPLPSHNTRRLAVFGGGEAIRMRTIYN